MLIWAYAAILAWSLTVPAPVMPAAEPMPRPEQIMAVPPELRAQLQQKVISPGGSGKERLDRLMDFMFQDSGLGMQYAVDATFTVEQAYRERKANCLTFTLLTVALAHEVGLQAYGQEFDRALAWRVGNDVVYRFSHVNAGVHIGGSRFTVDVARGSVILRHPPKSISDRRLLALYYNNRAVELIGHAPPALAEHYMAMALQLDPRYANGWANAGVLRLRQGDLHGAERDYLKALTLDSTNAGALFNLVALYRSNGNEARRAFFERRLEKVQLKDPYFQFMQATDDEQQGDYAGAVRHYRRAIRLYDGDSRFYLGLARAYRQLGRERPARRAMNRALALSRDAEGKSRLDGPGLRN